MIANNIFKATGDFFIWAFGPLEWMRNEISNWTLQNTVNWIFLLIAMVLFVYWMGQLMKFRREGTD